MKLVIPKISPVEFAALVILKAPNMAFENLFSRLIESGLSSSRSGVVAVVKRLKEAGLIAFIHDETETVFAGPITVYATTNKGRKAVADARNFYRQFS